MVLSSDPLPRHRKRFRLRPQGYPQSGLLAKTFPFLGNLAEPTAPYNKFDEYAACLGHFSTLLANLCKVIVWI